MTFAERCAAAVAAVPHTKAPDGISCGALRPNDGEVCSCDRDARIGRGLAAAILEYGRAVGTFRDDDPSLNVAGALRAFRLAAQGEG